jgi:hypothetical protein
MQLSLTVALQLQTSTSRVGGMVEAKTEVLRKALRDGQD